MTLISTAVRATHLVTNAAWFGGSLFGAVGLNPAARRAGSTREQVDVSGEGWERWGPVQGATIGLHLLVTENEERNAPMRAINDELGYRPQPVRMMLHGPLAPAQ